MNYQYSNQYSSQGSNRGNYSSNNDTFVRLCRFCRGEHQSGRCSVFPTAASRVECLRRSGHCIHCMSSHPSHESCRLDRPCFYCKGSHKSPVCPQGHTNVTANVIRTNPIVSTPAPTQSVSPVVGSTLAHPSNPTTVYLPLNLQSLLAPSPNPAPAPTPAHTLAPVLTPSPAPTPVASGSQPLAPNLLHPYSPGIAPPAPTSTTNTVSSATPVLNDYAAFNLVDLSAAPASLSNPRT